MILRQTTILDRTLARMHGAIAKLVLRAIPSAPASRPAGGPVVFRHYL